MPAALNLELLVTTGLGNNSFLAWDGSEAVAVDPPRDIGRILEAAARHDVRISHVLETHVHNDYVSGARGLAEVTDAEVVGPADAGYAFPHRPMRDGDDVAVDGLRLVAAATPGHTPEHLAYLVYERGADAPVAVFSGGSLMVGGAGRTDLIGPQRTDELTRSQFRSLRRLAALADTVQVLPTHGGGSFCAAGRGGEERVSTIGEERARNPALAAPDEETFVGQQLSGLLAYPTYYGSMAAINRRGAAAVVEPPLPRPLTPEEVEAAAAHGTWVVDVRDRSAFAREHLPGSIGVELSDSFASYVGWIVPFGAGLVLVVPEPPEEALREATTQLLRIGYDGVGGYLRGGIDAWRATGRPVGSHGIADVDELCRAIREGRAERVLDVRQAAEWDRGHLAASRHLFVGDLPRRLAEVPPGEPVWTVCASGQRAAVAASLLDRAGVAAVAVSGGGVEDLLRDCVGIGAAVDPVAAAVDD